MSDGTVAVETIPAGSEGRLALRQGQTARGGLPDPEHARLPDYPAIWLAQRLDEVRVEASLEIDDEGAPGMARVEVPDAPAGCAEDCRTAFAEAARRALSGWRFAPLEVLDWVDGPDTDGDGEPDTVARAVVAVHPYTLRFRFRFTQVDGRPRVGLDKSPG
ncbi:hypothetical protein [Pseudomarimonas salicorniae]|uniref:Uncharacterized protein n=1 Tax=Pseudomarimonas salicorniae TaxID=2933270 RepID=A0ABT0GC29_9GAMM|nr:hypothetical protein [Lysobacter sp. CAU 1642]MCK7592099.1 hypothetical protein [Lysobacter sp. CAU 1642]